MKRFTALLLAITLLASSMSVLSDNVLAEDYSNPADKITDIKDHWGNQPIYALINYGILSGYSDNTFRPDKQITRGEYIAALFKTASTMDESITSEENYMQIKDFDYMGYRNEERKLFLEQFKTKEYQAEYKDLESHWSKNVVGWVKNYSDKKQPDLFKKVFPGENFYPNKPITREEAVMATVAFTKPAVRDKNINFSDISSDYKFKNEINSLVNNEIINGYPDGTFKPKANITRAATATIMQKLLKEIAYNMDVFSGNNYMASIGSSNDGDYIASFLNEDLYENPPTVADKKYVAYFKAFHIDRKKVQEFYDGNGYENYTIEEFDEKYEEKKRNEIPQYRDESERLEVLKELKEEDYWNKAGLYYWLYRKDQNSPIEYLEKAEELYDIERNGKEDIYAIYNGIIEYYINNEKNSEKVIEYVEKTEKLYQLNENELERFLNVDRYRFNSFAANYLVDVEEYEKALDYIEKLFIGREDYTGWEFELSKGMLMYKTGQKSQGIEYLKENLKVIEQREDPYESLRTKYIWALKTMITE